MPADLFGGAGGAGDGVTGPGVEATCPASGSVGSVGGRWLPELWAGPRRPRPGACRNSDRTAARTGPDCRIPCRRPRSLSTHPPSPDVGPPVRRRAATECHHPSGSVPPTRWSPATARLQATLRHAATSPASPRATTQTATKASEARIVATGSSDPRRMSRTVPQARPAAATAGTRTRIDPTTVAIAVDTKRSGRPMTHPIEPTRARAADRCSTMASRVAIAALDLGGQPDQGDDRDRLRSAPQDPPDERGRRVAGQDHLVVTDVEEPGAGDGHGERRTGRGRRPG